MYNSDMKIISINVSGYEEDKTAHLFAIAKDKNFRDVLVDVIKDMGMDELNTKIGMMIYLLECDPERFKKYGIYKVNAESISVYTWETVSN